MPFARAVSVEVNSMNYSVHIRTDRTIIQRRIENASLILPDINRYLFSRKCRAAQNQISLSARDTDFLVLKLNLDCNM